MNFQKKDDEKFYLGIDCGSVSLKVAIINSNKQLVWKDYQKTHGQPLSVLQKTFQKIFDILKTNEFERIVTTGSGRKIFAEMLNAEPVDEITTHGLAAAFFFPEARSVIEIGGQDSKLIFLDKSESGETCIVESSMNDLCAAGTGSFLEQQSFRMGISIEELSQKAYQSANPAKIAGRCSVFAKTDMIHLQQDGVSIEDLSAGLCEAVVRTYIESVVKSRCLRKPILFQGAVSRNIGMKKAFAKVLSIDESDIIIPEHADIMGAIGSALYAIKKSNYKKQTKKDILDNINNISLIRKNLMILPRIDRAFIEHVTDKDYKSDITNYNEVYLGIDIGSVSAKIAVIDKNKRLIYKYYTEICGEPLEAVKKCLSSFYKTITINKNIIVRGVGVTGSGRNYIANYIGADVIKNEITAQATAAANLVPDVDTIIEIGGQDSKYIKMNNGAVVDFVMNKTCAAGTGSFLAEQADRLGVSLSSFSDTAINAKKPVDMGTRCTVFIESDLIHHQQNNTPKEDMLAGLSYSVAKNYLEKVSGNRPIGKKIVFQGGVAFNESVVAAFGQLLNKTIVIPPHHEITGALGIAYIALQELQKGKHSRFIGFDLENRIIEKNNSRCEACSNICKITQVKYNDGQESIYGGTCGKFEKDKTVGLPNITNYFEEREKLLMSYDIKGDAHKETIGIPKMLLFHELFPMWSVFFNNIGYRIEISDQYSKQVYEEGLSKILVDTCFPIKAIFGAVENLKKRGIQKIFIPYILDMPDEGYKTKFSLNCQYVQQIPDFIRSSTDTDILTATVRMKQETNNLDTAFIELGKQLGVSKSDAVIAIDKAIQAQKEFLHKCKELGNEALSELKIFDKTFVLIGHPYIIHDKFFNLNLAKRLAKIGIPAIPADLLPLEDSNTHSMNIDLIWKTNNRSVNAVEFIQKYNLNHYNKLLPVLLTTYGCASDSMLTPYLADILGKNPWLEIEMDEHNSISGALTRCEAFWESVKISDNASPSFINTDKYNSKSRTLKDIKREDRTLYIYPVSEAFVGIKDVLENYGVKCEMIPETTHMSDMLGRAHANEKHCRTYQVVLGDYMSVTRSEGFNPNKGAFFTFEYEDACRLALFKSLHEMVLKENGAGDFCMIAPVVDSSIDWFKIFGAMAARDMWMSLICYDYLSRYKYQVRPFEKIKGSVERAHEEALETMREGIKKKRMLKYFEKGMDIIKNVEVASRELVNIGIVGDAFTRVHKYGMNEIFDGIEKMGGCVILPPSWHDFVSYGSARRARTLWERGKYLKSGLEYCGSNGLIIYKKRIEKIAAKYSVMFPDQDNDWLTQNASKYVNPDIAAVIPSMFVGKCVDFVENKRVDGLLNAYGYNCNLGKTSTACYNRLRISNQNIPMLTFVDDGLLQTNMSTRLESFMNQAWAFRNKRKS